MPVEDQNNWGRFLGLGLQVAIGALVGFGVGWWVDKRYQTAPWGVTIGTMLGFASGMYMLIKEALRVNKD